MKDGVKEKGKGRSDFALPGGRHTVPGDLGAGCAEPGVLPL